MLTVHFACKLSKSIFSIDYTCDLIIEEKVIDRNVWKLVHLYSLLSGCFVSHLWGKLDMDPNAGTPRREDGGKQKASFIL